MHPLQSNAPRLPPAEVQHGDFSTLPPLYVVTVISNPIRWNSRYQLYHEFAQRVERAGGILYTVELAFGDRPFAITEADNPRHIRFRTTHELWHKENLGNLGVKALPLEARFIATMDADIMCTNPHWVNETVQQLQHYKVVQMFTHAVDQGPAYQPFATHRGFVYGWMQDPSKEPISGPGARKAFYGGALGPGDNGSLYHPGYAWAWRRDVIDGLGGFIEFAIQGSGDYQMARALVHRAKGSFHQGLSHHYSDALYDWQERCKRVVNLNVGYVENTLVHFWHGRKEQRNYWERNRILADCDYNPHTDIMHDSHGVLALTGNKVALRDGMMRYLRSRNEDGTDF